jgi:hypothetical protein
MDTLVLSEVKTMRWQDTRFRLACLTAALCLWVLLPASSALAYDNDPGVGEFYVGGSGQIGDRGPEGTSGGTGGGLEADPDTFQIDSRAGGSIGEVQAPAPQAPRIDHFTLWVRTWLMVVFGGGFLRGWLG